MITAKDLQLPQKAQTIHNAITFAQKEGNAVAIWRNPKEGSIQMIVDFSESFDHHPEPLDDSAPGFIFAPFDSPGKTYRIKADLHIDIDNSEASLGSWTQIDSKTENFLECLNEFTPPETEGTISVAQDDTSRQEFISLVEKAVRAIQQGDFQKVVPSRKKHISLETPLHLGNNFLKLAEAYPSAFISVVYVPGAGVWLGATPELLISARNNVFRTVALAGTQKYNEGISLSNVAWTQKEIEEQALVSRYIINCFKKIRLREFEELGPKTVVAGNLLHLKTEFKVDMEATNFPDLPETMLQLLHPTSAICGMPLAPARKFLTEEEKYDRSYFSGYLGPANVSDITELYVNLRCMHIEEKQCTLYAGAGVTEDSQPEKEWQETEIKMNTLLNIIK